MSGTPVATPDPGRPRASRTIGLSPSVFGVLVVAVFVGTIGLAMASGTWQLTGRPGAGGGGAGGGGGGGAGAAAQGQAAAQVKGWMAVGDVARAWGVPLVELLAAFGLAADTSPETPIKDLESSTFSVPALRDWLAGLSRGSPAPVQPDNP